MDNYPQEVGCRVRKASDDASIFIRNPGYYYQPGAVVEEVVSVEYGENFVLELFDEAGDGICCDYGIGEVSVYLGDEVDPAKLLAQTDGVYLKTDEIPFTASPSGVQPPDNSGGNNGNNGGNGNGTETAQFLVKFLTDQYPKESSWAIQNLNDEVVYQSGQTLNQPLTPVTQVVELKIGETYNFVVFDSFGDGLCKCCDEGYLYIFLLFTHHNITGCQYGNGDAAIYFGTSIESTKELVYIPGTFQFTDFAEFVAKDPASTGPRPNNPPAQSPTERPTQSFPTNSFCFPGDALSEVAGRGAVPMKKLKLGDKVLTKGGKYEPIYSFGHKSDKNGQYIELVTESTKLSLTKDHMVFVKQGRSVPASNVKVGDWLELASGEYEAVDTIRYVMSDGAYAPFTSSGTIVVNGVVSSSFVAFQGSETLLIGSMDTGLTYQFLAHTFELPHRLWCKYVSGCKSERYTEDGISVWVDVPHKAAHWFLRQNTTLMYMVSIPLLMFLAYSIFVILALIPISKGFSFRIFRKHW
jgi:hypothetical protein